MKRFPFKKIDAFATSKSDGNPAGYIRLQAASDITEQEMQQIAKELAGFVNEVGFVCKTATNEFSLRYYSAEREVDFCGHATVAIMYDVIKNDIDFVKMACVYIITNRGKLKVENRIATEDAVFIMAPLPQEINCTLDLINICKHLKIEKNVLNHDFQIRIINAGLNSLLIPIKDLSEILQIKPDISDLKSFCVEMKIDIVVVFTNDVACSQNDYRTRVFAPTFGYLEDPATGSGNAAFGYYLLSNKQFGKSTIVIEQNGSKESFNVVKLQKAIDETGQERIVFGGSAITRIEGEYVLQ